ncbi:YigZ family protein [Anaerolineales bacterium HSG6]|nr:YigZ family protein [Anaerolineales bacterium HSG6]
MKTGYLIPADEAQVELQIKNSRFVSRAAYTPTVESARAFIQRVKQEAGGFSHAVYAFAVGHGATVTHGMSDAGEPSGTAGRPALAVVKGSGLGDVTVVIVRYFGGTKLGTGGLVKAYTESAQLVLADLPTEMKVERKQVEVVIPYSFYEQFKRLVSAHHGQIDDEQFAADVTIQVTFIVADVPDFSDELSEATAGQVAVSER